MSGYASQREVREVTEATLRMEGRDPAGYNVAGIMRDAFYSRGPGYGYGAQDEATWRAAVDRHRKHTGPKPTVTYDGKTYTVRSYSTEIPDLEAMTRTAALVWLNGNTYATGRGTRTKPNPLAGLGEVISLEVR